MMLINVDLELLVETSNGGDCHVDGAIPLKPMGEDMKGTNLSEDFIEI